MTEEGLGVASASPPQPEAGVDATPSLAPNWAGRFLRFENWVNSASRALTGATDSNGYPMSAICVDMKGRRCHNGKDFMRARDEGAFPVWYFWDCEPEGASEAQS